MNTSSFTCSRERSVHSALHATSRVADVLFASLLLRLFGVGCTGKIRALSTNQRSPLFCFGFFGRDRAKPRVAQFLSCFVGPFVFSKGLAYICVSVAQMLNLRNALKVIQSVIGFITVNVVYLFGWVKVTHPTFGNNTVYQPFAAYAKIPPVMFGWRVRAMLSENFPAARDGVKVIKGAILDTIDRKANHAVSFVVANMITLPASRRNVKRVQ
jgi:hypothetical protein